MDALDVQNCLSQTKFSWKTNVIYYLVICANILYLWINRICIFCSRLKIASNVCIKPDTQIPHASCQKSSFKGSWNFPVVQCFQYYSDSVSFVSYWREGVLHISINEGRWSSVWNQLFWPFGTYVQQNIIHSYDPLIMHW